MPHTNPVRRISTCQVWLTHSGLLTKRTNAKHVRIKPPTHRSIRIPRCAPYQPLSDSIDQPLDIIVKTSIPTKQSARAAIAQSSAVIQGCVIQALHKAGSLEWRTQAGWMEGGKGWPYLAGCCPVHRGVRHYWERSEGNAHQSHQQP